MSLSSGRFDTHFVQNHFTPEVLEGSSEEAAQIAAGFISYWLHEPSNTANQATSSITNDSQKRGWRNRLN